MNDNMVISELIHSLDYGLFSSLCYIHINMQNLVFQIVKTLVKWCVAFWNGFPS